MKKKTSKIYVGGKVTGEPYALCVRKFAAAETALMADGWQVVNPLRVVNNQNAKWHVAMKKCIAALMRCDAICLLDDWKESAGARLEKELAEKLDMDIYYQQEE